MPKKNGVSKTYSFGEDTISKMNYLCLAERRTQTNLIERLVDDAFYLKNGGGFYGKGTKETGSRENRPNSV